MYSKSKVVVLVLLCFRCSVLCQTSNTFAIDHRIGVGISLFYYHPYIENLNAGFSKVENDLALPRWQDFSVSYLVLPTVYYVLNQNNQIALQAGGSYLVHVRDDRKSYYYLWMLGGEYQYEPLPPSLNKYPTGLRLSIGAGLLGAQFYRSYGNDRAIYMLSRKPYIDGAVVLSVEMNKRLSINTEIRYLYVPTMEFENLGTELKLKSFMMGIGYTYLL